jgi:hypothetical protein
VLDGQLLGRQGELVEEEPHDARVEVLAKPGVEVNRREAGTLLYTLFESAKLAGVDPHAYVLKATRRAIASPDAVTLPEDIT